jgi:hypothetical protein
LVSKLIFENQEVGQKEKNAFSVIFVIFICLITLVSLWSTFVKIFTWFSKARHVKIVSKVLPTNNALPTQTSDVAGDSPK